MNSGEQEGFRLRLKEVQRAMSENTIAKPEKERDRLIEDMRQLSLIDIGRRVQEDRLRDLEAELQRRSSHFNELLGSARKRKASGKSKTPGGFSSPLFVVWHHLALIDGS